MKDPFNPSPSEQDSSGTLSNAQGSEDYADAPRAVSDQKGAYSKGNGTYLVTLSELSARSFASTSEALGAVLKLIVNQLRLRSSFVTHIDRKEGQNKVLLSYNAPGSSDIPTEALLELADTF
jgi:hypothetical protein